MTEPETAPNPSEAGPVEAHPSEAGPVEAHPSEAGPVEAHPSEAGPVEAHPSEAGPVEASPVEADPSEAGPVEAGPSETGPVAGPVGADLYEAGPVEADLPEADPFEIGSDIGWPDTDAETATRARLLATGTGAALGRLGELAIWLSGVQGVSPPHEPRRPRLIVFSAASAASAASAESPDSADSPGTAEPAGAGPSAVFAAVADVGLRAVPVGGAADASPAAKIRNAIETGIRIADEEIDSGADLLAVGALGSASATAAAVVVSVMTLVEPIKVVGPSHPLGDQAWMREVAEIRDTRLKAVVHRHEVEALLIAVASAQLAAITGFLMRAAVRRTPVILDTKIVGAAALLAREISPNAVRWWQAGDRGTDPANLLALAEFSAVALSDLELDLGDGVGAVLAVPLVRAAARAANDLPVTGE